MSRRKQRQIGSLILLFLVVGFLAFRVWRQLREDLLSAQLITVLKDLYPPLKIADDPKGLYRQRAIPQNREKEAEALHLLKEGASPNARDIATCPHSFWEEVRYLMRRMSEPPPNPAVLPPSALAIAVQADDTVIATALLKAGANDVNAEIDPTNVDFRFPLVNYAAYQGNLEIVQALCAHGANLHKRSHNHNPVDYYFPEPEREPLVRPAEEPLLQSVLRGGVEDILDDQPRAPEALLDRKRRVAIFHLLLTQGAKYDPNGQEGYALLAVAAEGDYLEVARELLEAGVLPNADPDWLDDPPSVTPLDYAVRTDDLPLVELLLRKGASAGDFRSEPPIIYTGNVQMVRLLLKYGAKLEAGETRGKHEGDNQLNRGCLAGDADDVLFWIKLGINVNTGGDYTSPIAQAAEYGNVKTVRLLLEHGAKVGPNSPGANALWLAIAESNFESAKLILRYGASVNDNDPLGEAVRQESAEMALALLKRGANVNAKRGEALFEACESCDEDLVKILLEHGADPTIRSEDGTTAIQAAKESADPPEDADGIVALLKRYGAKQ